MASSARYQHTLAGPAIFAGVGMHTGERVRAAIKPAPADSGVTFVRIDVHDRDNRIPARGDLVVQTRLGTVLGNEAGVTAATVEHLLAAMAALGVDNAIVELDGPEVPVMDGSALPFIELLDHAGLRRQEALRRYIQILEPIEVAVGDATVKLTPADDFEMAFEIAYPDGLTGVQRVELAVDESSFRGELADCRTFGFLFEVEALRRAGLARGGSLENAVVFDGDRLLNPEGLRRPDEPVRHKALDAIGDLYLLGAPLIGRYEGVRAGHASNNAIVRAVLARPEAWRSQTFPEVLAEAV